MEKLEKGEKIWFQCPQIRQTKKNNVSVMNIAILYYFLLIEERLTLKHMAIDHKLYLNYDCGQMDTNYPIATICYIIILLCYRENHKYQHQPFACPKIDLKNYQLLILLKIKTLPYYRQSNESHTYLNQRLNYEL